jgi:hypothetical protein
MLSNSYGKSISNADANRHFNLVMQIKQRWHDKLSDLLKDDPEALRYYCGLENNFESDLCFVFDKDIIQGLRDKMDEGLADGLVIFNGVREKKDSPIEGEEGNFSDIDGRPTLMIFPYKMATPESPKSKFKLVIMNGDDEGYEHPGTGGKPPGGKLKNKEGKYEVPGNFESIEIHKFL